MADINFRDFDAEIAERDPGEPVSFKLNGVVFQCIDPMPLGSILVLARHAGSEDIVSASKQASILWDFVEPEQHDDLDVAISKLPDLTVMQQILEHIITAATGRPTPGS
jgi:hypothetical protein